jgi:hypothetical protein
MIDEGYQHSQCKNITLAITLGSQRSYMDSEHENLTKKYAYIEYKRMITQHYHGLNP